MSHAGIRTTTHPPQKEEIMKRLLNSVATIAILAVLSVTTYASDKDIVDTAVSAKSFNTLVAAAKAAGLVDTLKSEGPLTVFAPTDDAFAKLPEGTVESLLKPENKAKLAAILKYHVVAGKVLAADVVKLKQAQTVEGSNVKIKVKDGTVKLNKAKVVKTDIECSNGVIHVIDTVLMPPMKQAEVRKHLEHAVARGAALYNAGHHEQCAQVYAKTMTRIMKETVTGMDSDEVRQMNMLLTIAEKQHDAGKRAWVLRHGIDRMYSLVTN